MKDLSGGWLIKMNQITGKVVNGPNKNVSLVNRRAIQSVSINLCNFTMTIFKELRDDYQEHKNIRIMREAARGS